MADPGFPCGLALVDERGRLREVNEHLCAITQRSIDVLVGKPVTQLLAPAGRVLYQTYLMPLLRLHGRVEEFAVTLQGGDGQPHDVLIYAQTVPGGGMLGDRAYRLAFVSYRARRAVDDELLRVRRAADQVPGLVFEFRREADGRAWFPYASEGSHRITGCLPEQLRSSAEPLLGRLSRVDRARFGAVPARPPGRAIDGWIEHFVVACHEAARAGDADGEIESWLEVHASARVLPDGAVCWQGYLADVSARRRLEEEAASRHAAEQVRLSQMEFLGRVSHELRTPLNAILAFSQLLATGEPQRLSEGQLQQAGLIASAATQLRQLVDDLMAMSRAEAQGFGVELATCDVRPIVHRCVALAAPAATEAGVEVQTEMEPTELLAVADPRRLAQVIDNLLGNAIKYNHRGGRVLLRVRVRRGELRLTVRDSGRGLSPTQCRALFRPFDRLGAETTGVPGTGLGLVITRQLVERMGGRIGVESEPGTGSAFQVSLPLSAPLSTPLPERLPVSAPVSASELAPPHAGMTARRECSALDAPSSGLPASTQRTSHDPRRLPVLYVEDNEVNVQVMSAIMMRRGHADLCIATTGAEALLAAAVAPPALLLIDQHLPDTTGTELLRRIRQDPRLANVPAYLVTAASDGAALARTAGFDGCWTKPLNPAAVLTAFDVALRSPAASRLGPDSAFMALH